MHAKLSSRVERVIELARSIAGSAEREYLGTEHVLAAIQQEGSGVGAKLLEHFKIDEPRLKEAVDRFTQSDMEQTWVFGKLPGSPYLKTVVAAAIDMAERMKADAVCTEHLLLAMLNEEGCVAQQALADLGVTYQDAHDSLKQLSTPS